MEKVKFREKSDAKNAQKLILNTFFYRTSLKVTLLMKYLLKVAIEKLEHCSGFFIVLFKPVSTL